jgi:hypothetical protein
MVNVTSHAINYNLRLWLCAKKSFVLLARLILGNESITSEVFNVYMEPLVEEILQLWYEISTYNITKERGPRTITLQVFLM